MGSNVASNIKTLGQCASFLTNKSKIMKNRLIDAKSKQHVLRVDENDTCEPIDINKLDVFLENEYDAIVISDYDKGFLPSASLKKIIPKLSGLIFVDSKKRDLSFFEGCILKINKSEQNLASRMPENCELIVTLGDKGAEWQGKVYPAENIHDVFDVCGAGDTFLAALVVHYCQFKNIEGAVMFANKCARVTVQRSGVHSVSLIDVL
jgi:D-beta-D-heptose 7-phosphate kinase/D-beta-D-heptose 1-phosphate adenosyltransferase